MRYEFVLGFVGLAVSLSAFKDELSKFALNFVFVQVSLSDYFFAVLVSLLLSLYLHVLERSFCNTKLGNLKIFDYCVYSAQAIFVFTIISPAVLLLIWGSIKIVLAITAINEELQRTLSARISFLMGVLAGSSGIYFVYRQTEQNRVQQLEELEKEEISDLETAERLYRDKYYSQTILESFKLVEIHLYKLLQMQGVRAQRKMLAEMISLALRHGIIAKEDLPRINALRELRNSAAHLKSQHTKEEAENAIAFVKSLIMQNRSA